MDKELQGTSDFLFYADDNGKVRVQVILGEETVWANQKTMGELFDVDRSVITKHLKNIFETNELNEDSVSAKIAQTALDGKNYQVKFYNLDAIIAVGYRVNSYKATQFRIWATKVLREYLIKGFAMDDERLKQSKPLFGKDYFDELLERMREGIYHFNTHPFFCKNDLQFGQKSFSSSIGLPPSASRIKQVGFGQCGSPCVWPNSWMATLYNWFCWLVFDNLNVETTQALPGR